jgi:cytochrome c5
MVWLGTERAAARSALLSALAIVLLGSVLRTAAPVGSLAGQQSAGQPDPRRFDLRAHDYESNALTPEQKAGRDTWYFWTGGNQTFWRRMAAITEGNVDLLMYLDSRLHDRRFEELGVINEPGCKAATGPDRYGLWLDDCSEATPVPNIPGQAAGIVGLRRFDNPAFDALKWNLDQYLKDRRAMEPPYLVGMSCGFCHVGFNPINPPADPNRARWANLSPGIGNQYFLEGKLFSLNMMPDDFRWHVSNRQPPGTSDTSRFATDHINNPNAINTILNLADRPTAPETMRDGSVRNVHHILKDGADSIGVAGASMRVYVNIGMCGDYFVTLHDPVWGVKQSQRPFDIDHARATCQDWRDTEARMAGAEAFLKTLRPLRLADAPAGRAYLTVDESVLRRGKIAFADNCASCHSSKQPPPGVTNRAEWFRQSVLADDFLQGNFLSDDRRNPVTRIGTNIARAVGSNATRGHIWDQFSSETYKAQPPAGVLTGLHNPRDPDRPIDFVLPDGGRGYYRTASLTSIWATAPYLHNNSVGVFIKDPSISGRMTAFRDGIEKLLWPETRLAAQSIPVTTIDSTIRISGTTRTIRVPAGTPIDYIARVDPTRLAELADSIPVVNLVLKLTPDDVLLGGLLKRNLAPDFVLDRGHTFGADLSDEDKRALIEFLKSF